MDINLARISVGGWKSVVVPFPFVLKAKFPILSSICEDHFYFDKLY